MITTTVCFRHLTHWCRRISTSVGTPLGGMMSGYTDHHTGFHRVIPCDCRVTWGDSQIDPGFPWGDVQSVQHPHFTKSLGPGTLFTGWFRRFWRTNPFYTRKRLCRYWMLPGIDVDTNLIGHTFTPKNDRPFRIVIRNLRHSTPVDEIQTALEARSHIRKTIPSNWKSLTTNG
jgi:hypothetical protein